MLDYLTHKANRSTTEEMFDLMEATEAFMEKHDEDKKQFYPFIALGLVECLEERMLQNADKNDPSAKGELPLTAMRSIAHQLQVDAKLLSEFVQLAVDSGVLKADTTNEKAYVWSPEVARCVLEWQKKRDAQSNGGKNSRKGKNGICNDLQPLDEQEVREFHQLNQKKNRLGLDDSEAKRFELFSQRYYGSGQGTNHQ